MIPLAHIGGFPLEEVLPSVVAGLIGARAWLSMHLQRRRRGAR